MRYFILLIFALSYLNSQSQFIITIAGTYYGYSGDGGLATNAKMAYVSDVATDPAGNTYVADQYNNCIRKIDLSGVISTFAGNGVAGYSGDGTFASTAQLNHPTEVITDASGNIYIADQYNHRIRMVNPGGIISTFAGTGVAGFSGDGGPASSAQLCYPYGLGIDLSGAIYIADECNNRIRKVNPSGTISTAAGSGISGYNGDGISALSAQLQTPRNVVVDMLGNIYITDQLNNRIRMVNSSGIISTIAGTGVAGFSGDGGPGNLAQICNGVFGIDVYGGNLYISDFTNYRIRVVNSSGIISTFCGNGNPGFSGDGGPPQNAELNGPTGLGFDNLGNLLIADYYNSKVRRIVFPSAIKENSKNKISVTIFPNPVSSLLSVQCESETEKAIKIKNILGEELYKNNFENNLNVDVSKFDSGIYFLTIESGENSVTQKIAVTH